MKYEMIFGDEALFDGVGVFTGMDIITRNIDDGLYRSSRLSDSTPSSLRKNPVVAMRRIIAEPKRWTWENKKAGVLPEVSAELIHKTRGICEFIGVGLDEDACWALKLQSGSIYIADKSGCSPIETPAEKEQREEDEFIRSISGTDIHYGTGTVKVLFEQGVRAAYRKLKGGE